MASGTLSRADDGTALVDKVYGGRKQGNCGDKIGRALNWIDGLDKLVVPAGPVVMLLAYEVVLGEALVQTHPKIFSTR